MSVKGHLKWYDKWESVFDAALILVLIAHPFTYPVLKWSAFAMFGATFLIRFYRTARQKTK